MTTTSKQRLDWLFVRLCEGDRVRLVRFAEALLTQKQAKKEQRQKRFTQRASTMPE